MGKSPFSMGKSPFSIGKSLKKVILWGNPLYFQWVKSTIFTPWGEPSNHHQPSPARHVVHVRRASGTTPDAAAGPPMLGACEAAGPRRLLSNGEGKILHEGVFDNTCA